MCVRRRLMLLAAVVNVLFTILKKFPFEKTMHVFDLALSEHFNIKQYKVMQFNAEHKQYHANAEKKLPNFLNFAAINFYQSNLNHAREI